MAKQVIEARIKYHGVESEQYFTGHGVSFTKYTDCATGIGDSPLEAFEDAAEQLVCGDFNFTAGQTAELEAEAARIQAAYDHVGAIELGDEQHVYVSIDVRVQS